MASVESDEFEFLENEDLISWLLTNADGANIAQDPLNVDCSLPYVSPSSYSNGNKRPLSSISNSSSSSLNSKRANTASSASMQNNFGDGVAVNRKKTMKMEALEAKIKEITQENEELSAHLMTVQKRTIEMQKQRTLMEKTMENKVRNMPSTQHSDAELASIMQQYSSMYADYGEFRKKEVSFHLQQIEKLILPTTTTKLCLWVMQQDKSFYSTKSALYNTFCAEVGITPEQSIKIQERREKIIHLMRQLKESLELTKVIKQAIEEKHDKFDATCSVIQNIGNQKQVVAFLLWITKNADRLSQVIPDFWKGKEALGEEKCA